MITESTPEETGAASPPSPTVSVPGPAAPVLNTTDPSADPIPAAAEGLSREETSAATVTEQQPEPLSPDEEVPAGEPSEEAQRAATLPDGLSVEEKPDVMPAPETEPSLSLEVPHGVPAPPTADSPAPAPVERLVKMAEELAAENRVALERERERADALAHELALAREELGALRLRPSFSWGTAPLLVMPAPEATQAAGTEITPAEPADRANAEPMTAPLPAPSTENDRTASVLSIPSSSQTSSANEQRLVDRAEALLQARDISGARLLLERAAERGSARGAYLLAQTYDPSVLARWQVRGVPGDPEKARKFYEQSRMPADREVAASPMLR
ncbi:hypothetical protein [Microvirga vignae]|uniref:hypothetical protein n=1 Tax=Microvirga vignae TaxID=1225564 RepID=UPI00123778B7|nr:hypothetical protein [Microvirga vignae]